MSETKGIRTSENSTFHRNDNKKVKKIIRINILKLWK